MDTRYYTTAQVAEMLGVTTRTIRNYLNEGKLSGTKFGGRWNFTQEDIDKYIESQNEEVLTNHPWQENQEDYIRLETFIFRDTIEELTLIKSQAVEKFNALKKSDTEFTSYLFCRLFEEELKLNLSLVGPVSEIKILSDYMNKMVEEEISNEICNTKSNKNQ